VGFYFMKTFIFCYSINGVFTELPSYLFVEAADLESAKKKAKRKFELLLAVISWGRWVYKKEGFDGKWKKIWKAPYRHTGTIYLESGRERQPTKPFNFDKSPSFPVGYEKAMASVSSALTNVIEQAPSISELFKVQPLNAADANCSIPIIFSSRTRPKDFTE